MQNYSIVNYTGFIKILKKADKLTKYHFRDEMMVEISTIIYCYYLLFEIKQIANQPFHTSDEIDQLMVKTEHIFGSTFFGGDVRQAKRVLRIPEAKADSTVKDTF